MKRWNRLIIIALCVSCLVQLPVFGASPTFNDISGYWAESEIIAFAGENIVSGYPDGSFKPDKYVTRAEFAKIVSLAFGLTEEHPVDYPDARDTDWYYPYLRFVVPYIRADEMDNASFNGDGNMHRIDAFAALVELKKYKEASDITLPPIEEIYEEVKSTYKDIDYQVGKIEYPNVQREFTYTWLTQHMGIMNLEDSGYFYPHSGMARAELLAIIRDMQKQWKE